MWWFILGAILVAGAVVVTAKVIIDKIMEHIRKKREEEALKQKMLQEALHKVGLAIEQGDYVEHDIGLFADASYAKIEKKYSNKVEVGIYSKSGSKIDELTIEGDSVSDDIREGQIITIQS